MTLRGFYALTFILVAQFLVGTYLATGVSEQLTDRLRNLENDQAVTTRAVYRLSAKVDALHDGIAALNGALDVKR